METACNTPALHHCRASEENEMYKARLYFNSKNSPLIPSFLPDTKTITSRQCVCTNVFHHYFPSSSKSRRLSIILGICPEICFDLFQKLASPTQSEQLVNDKYEFDKLASLSHIWDPNHRKIKK